MQLGEVMKMTDRAEVWRQIKERQYLAREQTDDRLWWKCREEIHMLFSRLDEFDDALREVHED